MKHVETVHFGKTNHCKICDRNYKSKYEFKEHFETIHEGKRLQCDKCDKTFTSTNSLRRHQGGHEFKDNGLVLKCTECGKKYSARRFFVEHVSKVHKGLQIEPEIVPAENID